MRKPLALNPGFPGSSSGIFHSLCTLLHRCTRMAPRLRKTSTRWVRAAFSGPFIQKESRSAHGIGNSPGSQNHPVLPDWHVPLPREDCCLLTVHPSCGSVRPSRKMLPARHGAPGAGTLWTWIFSMCLIIDQADPRCLGFPNWSLQGSTPCTKSGTTVPTGSLTSCSKEWDWSHSPPRTTGKWEEFGLPEQGGCDTAFKKKYKYPTSKGLSVPVVCGKADRVQGAGLLICWRLIQDNGYVFRKVKSLPIVFLGTGSELFGFFPLCTILWRSAWQHHVFALKYFQTLFSAERSRIPKVCVCPGVPRLCVPSAPHHAPPQLQMGWGRGGIVSLEGDPWLPEKEPGERWHAGVPAVIRKHPQSLWHLRAGLWFLRRSEGKQSRRMSNPGSLRMW